MGKILIFGRIKMKFRFWLYKKRLHTSWKFQLETRSKKKVIAKKPLTNLYEMNSYNCPLNHHHHYHHVYRHDVTKVGDFYNGGLWRKSLFFVGCSWNFVSGRIKNVDTHLESFSVKKQCDNKKVIAKKPLTNLY